MKKGVVFLFSLVLLAGLLVALPLMTAQAQDPAENPDLVLLGKLMFFDKNLSVNGMQSCADCHAPEVGYTGPDSAINAGGAVYEGAILNRFGNRKPPAAAYAGDSPNLHFDEAAGEWVGGMFWDGRATGAHLGDPLAEQAGGPFLNPLEQGMPNARLLVVKVAESSYAGLFEQVWGQGSLNFTDDVDSTYERIERSIAAYERSAEVNPFSSKFDLFWDAAQAAGKDVSMIRMVPSGVGSGATATAAVVGGSVTQITVTNGGSGYLVPPAISFMGGGMMGGGSGAAAVASIENGVVTKIEVTSGGSGYRMARVVITPVDPYNWQNYRGLGLDDTELSGLAAFNDPNRGNCASCHSLEAGPAGYPLFTNYGYDNIGMPKNPANPYYNMPKKWNPDGENWIDTGLGGYLKSAGYEPAVYELEMGKFKVPTLRNVDLRPTPETIKAYGHNGYFKSLEDLVFFYHWRGMMDNGCMGGGGGMGGGGMGGGGMGGCSGMADRFPPPEVDQNRAELGMFPMMLVDDIVVFLRTLSDGYQP